MSSCSVDFLLEGVLLACLEDCGVTGALSSLAAASAGTAVLCVASVSEGAATVFFLDSKGNWGVEVLEAIKRSITPSKLIRSRSSEISS